jgi:hypothetical protein
MMRGESSLSPRLLLVKVIPGQTSEDLTVGQTVEPMICKSARFWLRGVLAMKW